MDYLENIANDSAFVMHRSECGFLTWRQIARPSKLERRELPTDEIKGSKATRRMHLLPWRWVRDPKQKGVVVVQDEVSVVEFCGPSWLLHTAQSNASSHARQGSEKNSLSLGL